MCDCDRRPRNPFRPWSGRDDARMQTIDGVAPVNEEHINPDLDGPRRTICQVLREAYSATGDARVRGLLDEAHVMAKRMDRKLREYKADYDAEGFWSR